jgi:ATP adenylyltransferase
MQHIRSPWRQAYVTSVDQVKACVLCAAAAAGEAADSLVVHSGTHCFVVMNLYPYNSGHVMISPRRHVARLIDATLDELSEMMALAQRLEGVLGDVYRPDGMNIGMNLGRSAGAGIADHIHLHLVPRWAGDTNFISVLGETRVIPEDAAKACARLRTYFETR